MNKEKAIELLEKNQEFLMLGGIPFQSITADIIKIICENNNQVLAELQADQPCKTCGGVHVIHSGLPTMYNCELGGDCSEDPTWTKERCKTCGKTVPCPECRPTANEYYHLWNREIRRANLLSAENAKLKKQRPACQQPASKFVKEARISIRSYRGGVDFSTYWAINKLEKALNIIDRQNIGISEVIGLIHAATRIGVKPNQQRGLLVEAIQKPKELLK